MGTHFHSIARKEGENYEFRKEVRARTAARHIQHVYLELAPVFDLPTLIIMLYLSSSRINRRFRYSFEDTSVRFQIRIVRFTFSDGTKQAWSWFRDVSIALTQSNRSSWGKMFAGNGKWIVCDNVLRKRNWKQVCGCEEHVSKARLHLMNVLLRVWWGCRVVIHFHFVLAGDTITAKKYCHELTNHIASVHEKRQIITNRKVWHFQLGQRMTPC